MPNAKESLVLSPDEFRHLCQEVLPMISASGVYLDKSRWQEKFLAAPGSITSRFFEICEPCAQFDQLGGCTEFGGRQEITAYTDRSGELLYVPGSVMAKFGESSALLSKSAIEEKVGVWALKDYKGRRLLTHPGILGVILKLGRSKFRLHVESEIWPSIKANGFYVSAFLSEKEEEEVLQILKQVDPDFSPTLTFSTQYTITKKQGGQTNTHKKSSSSQKTVLPDRVTPSLTDQEVLNSFESKLIELCNGTLWTRGKFNRIYIKGVGDLPTYSRTEKVWFDRTSQTFGFSGNEATCQSAIVVAKELAG